MSRVFNSRVSLLLALMAALLFLPVLTLGIPGGQVAAHTGQHQTAADSNLRDTMRSLWEDHIVWTRLFIVSNVAGLPDEDATAQRLLQNQVEIGEAITPYYGRDAAGQLAALLQEHILGAAAILDAAKSGDQAKFASANAAWYGNGNEIAAYLNSLNPEHWPLDVMQEQMKMHLDLTLAEASARLSGDFASDIVQFDQIRTHILEFADFLTEGIQAQFPAGVA